MYINDVKKITKCTKLKYLLKGETFIKAPFCGETDLVMMKTDTTIENKILCVSLRDGTLMNFNSNLAVIRVKQETEINFIRE